VFGYTELELRIELSENSKSKLEKKWLLIQFLLFGCVWNLLLESKVVPNSNSCLDVGTTELNDLLSLDNITCVLKIACVYQNVYIYIILHIKNTYILP
jgi:hypothetical protein